MSREDLISYVSEAKKRGLSVFQIKQSLLDNGWKESEVESVFREYSSKSVVPDHMDLINFRNFMIFFLIFVILFTIIVFFILNSPEKKIKEEEIKQGVYFSLAGKPILLETSLGNLRLVYSKTRKEYSQIRINDKLNEFNLSESKVFDLNSDGVYDLRINLTKIVSDIPKFYVIGIAENSSLIIKNETEKV